MNEKQLTIVEEYELFKPLIHKTNSLIDNCIRDCHNKYYHTFEYKCVNDAKLNKIRTSEIGILTIADEEMNYYGINQKIKVARQRSSISNQINKLTIKIYRILYNINLC